ncbi:flavin reductase family protein [Ornithinimicrobium sp. F0845]|uniref:flavin reductase family protein n=1 Tax=Ornithinimicrobium sp. F0845 TaxID=2926412 RepID=UPI001FF5F076|nr:flavin reductase family protein [Ornithinimicrobium sp. F0845]MCK0112617.1 flavin reductase family protein [Ornithinimicrobium sp. F0845]
MSAQPLTRPTIPPESQPVDLRHAFGRAASSTWVVTGSGERGPVGFTAISIVSVSVSPPLVSFNIAKTSSSLVTIAQSGRAALHLLAEDQEPLAQRFARDRTRRFVDDGAWAYDDHGLPTIHGAASRLVTRIHDLVDAGDSFLAVARVEHAVTSGRRPLLHHAGAYTPLGEPALHSLTHPTTPGA